MSPGWKRVEDFSQLFFVTLMYMSDIIEALRSVRINGFSKFAM